MNKLSFILFFVSIMAIQGCGTPQVVKSLSLEQLKAQKSSRETMGAYFSIMEDVINRQITVSKNEEDTSLKKEISIYKKKYSEELKKNGSDKQLLLDMLSNKIKESTETAINFKQNYDSHLIDLKNKHMEMLDMMDNMVVAQETLNSYIQIEKADEVVGNKIFSALGTNQEKIRKYGREINNILTNMNARKSK